MPRLSPSLWWCVGLWACAETEVDLLVPPLDDAQVADAAEAARDAGLTPDAQPPDAGPSCPPRLDLCVEVSAPVVGCICDGLITDQAITVAGGGLAVGGDLQGARLTVEGPLFNPGRAFVVPVRVEVAGLEASAVAHQGDLHVDGDALVAGPLRVGGALTVTGTLRQPAGAPRDVDGAERLEGGVARTDARPGQPCPCDGALAARIATAAAQPGPDGPALGLEPDALRHLERDRTLALPCGDYAFDRIGGPAGLTLTISGRTTLRVRGDIRLDGALTVALTPGAELDLVVGGTVVAGQAVALGDPARPEALRLWLGGHEAVSLSGPLTLNGALVAPDAPVVLSAPPTLRGPVFARRLSTTAALTVLGAPLPCASPD